MNNCVSFSAVNSYESIQLKVDLISRGFYHNEREEKAIIRKILKKPYKTYEWVLFFGWFFWAGIFYANPD